MWTVYCNFAYKQTVALVGLVLLYGDKTLPLHVYKAGMIITTQEVECTQIVACVYITVEVVWVQCSIHTVAVLLGEYRPAVAWK